MERRNYIKIAREMSSMITPKREPDGALKTLEWEGDKLEKQTCSKKQSAAGKDCE
jgi:hypothetical protein